MHPRLLWKINNRHRLPVGSPRENKIKECASKLEASIVPYLSSKLRQMTRFMRAARDTGCWLFELPEELLLEILKHLPHSSLYLLRQTCTTFRRVSMDSTFRDFNLEFSKPLNESFCITQAGYEQRKMIRNVLVRRTHCDDCNRFRETGHLKEKMMELYEPMFCRVCDDHHAALFFARDQRYCKLHGGGCCLGRRGSFPICSHISLSAYDLRSFSLAQRETTCWYPSHWLRARSGNQIQERFSPPPRFTASADEGSTSTFCLRVKTSILLLEIDPCKIDIELVRQSLKRAARSPDGQHFCKHISLLSETVLSSLASDACTCFSDEAMPCKEHALMCRHCGAVYNLEYQRRETGSTKAHLFLSMNVNWRSIDPLTPIWLFNLEFGYGGPSSSKKKKKKTRRHPVFDSGTKHVLWCDSPGCATGSELRWMKMAKTVFNETQGCRKTGSTDKFDLAAFSSSRWSWQEYDAFFEARRKYGDSPSGRRVFWQR
ncbi:hypothetical protein MRS44_007458 [Fusarium solani]|uniref:uncharacterized protein n=1 Tax=Fusarium solani TaxID=169388 RepID=UPI0032C42089|nr:hypothetical protein MRS44_007458 [Fusarium solani]